MDLHAPCRLTLNLPAHASLLLSLQMMLHLTLLLPIVYNMLTCHCLTLEPTTCMFSCSCSIPCLA